MMIHDFVDHNIGMADMQQEARQQNEPNGNHPCRRSTIFRQCEHIKKKPNDE